MSISMFNTTLEISIKIISFISGNMAHRKKDRQEPRNTRRYMYTCIIYLVRVKKIVIQLVWLWDFGSLTWRVMCGS